MSFYELPKIKDPSIQPDILPAILKYVQEKNLISELENLFIALNPSDYYDIEQYNFCTNKTSIRKIYHMQALNSYSIIQGKFIILKQI